MIPADRMRRLASVLRRVRGSALLAAVTFSRDELGPLEINAATASIYLNADVLGVVADELEAISASLDADDDDVVEPTSSATAAVA